jgi:hypothetical protein
LGKGFVNVPTAADTSDISSPLVSEMSRLYPEHLFVSRISADNGHVRVTREQVLRFRVRASGLHRRLPFGDLAAAASGGLQDSAPRAGVVSLYARAEDVGPDSWEAPDLAQIWFRFGADYIIPRTDIGIFTIGSLPRDPDKCRALEDVADAAINFLAGRTLKVREVSNALRLDEPFMMLRAAGSTGRLLIRWNASMIWLVPNERPDIDPEEARLELARRFLRWFAPATRDQYAKWVAAEPADAKRTWEALSSELESVELGNETRYVLRSDADALAGAAVVEGVRLLPHADPLIKIDGELAVPDPTLRLEIFPSFKSKPTFWPVSGGLLLNGEFAGSWARQQRRVTVHPWQKLPRRVRESVEREALAFPIASKSKAAVVWTN